ncbi:GIY-YIG nuclease family protein [Micromonospora echinospora]|uniref:GIY-YIG nuclease family protein n=1 Tax=Micromonospora echinospora TaxID=1877 RepID=UPI00379D7C01
MRDPLSPRSIDPRKYRSCRIPLTIGVCGKTAPEDSPIPACLEHLAEAWSYCQDRIFKQKQALLPQAQEERNQRIASGLLDYIEEARKDAEQLAQDPEIDDHTSVVYYLRFADRIKIGYSRNLGSRLIAIPHDELLVVEPGAREVERRRHEQFAKQRIKGEWFTITDDLMQHIETLRVRHAERHKERDRIVREGRDDICGTSPVYPMTERQMIGITT